MEISKLMECLPEDINQINKQIQLASTLEGPTAALTSDRCVIFFSDITKTSIMCADVTKKINSENKVSYPKAIILWIILQIILDSFSNCFRLFQQIILDSFSNCY